MIARLAVVSGILSLALMAGCSPSGGLYREAAAAAEAGLAVHLRNTIALVTSLMREQTAPGAIGEAEIARVFGADLRSVSPASSGPVDGRGVFEITPHANGDVAFSVLFVSTAFRAAGLTSTNAYAHTCGTLTAGAAGPDVIVTNRECPPEIAASAADESVFVPLETVAADAGVGGSPK